MYVICVCVFTCSHTVVDMLIYTFILFYTLTYYQYEVCLKYYLCHLKRAAYNRADLGKDTKGWKYTLWLVFVHFLSISEAQSVRKYGRTVSWNNFF